MVTDLLRINVKIKIANKININICMEMSGNVLNFCINVINIYI